MVKVIQLEDTEQSVFRKTINYTTLCCSCSFVILILIGKQVYTNRD